MNASTKPVRIGVDIGGTFTDLQIFDARDGRIVAHKLPTTPEDPSIALVEGIKTAGRRYGFTLSDVGYLMHGTTIATNAVLERKLPRGVLIAAPFTHQEMANMIGSTRETVTLTLGDLRKKGVIEIDRRRIVVLDREALRSRV